MWYTEERREALAETERARAAQEAARRAKEDAAALVQKEAIRREHDVMKQKEAEAEEAAKTQRAAALVRTVPSLPEC